MKKRAKSPDIESVLGGMAGDFIKDLWNGKQKKEDLPKKEIEVDNIEANTLLTGDAVMDIQRMYIAQKVLTGEASAWVKKQMKNIGILREWEKRDLSGYIRLVHGKIRESIESGKGIINIEKIVFKD